MKENLSREILEDVLLESILAYTLGGAAGSGAASLVNHVADYKRDLKNLKKQMSLCKDERCKQLLTNKISMEKKKILADIKQKLKHGVVGGGLPAGFQL